MRGVRVGLTLGLALLGAASVQAQEHHPWLIRARGVVIAPSASSKPKGLDVNTNATMEVDIGRMLTPHLSIELILATSGHEVKAGNTSLGSANVLPPTLLLQFRPLASGASPYIGAGVNMTYFYGQSGGLQDLDLTTSIGYAGQAGIDIPLGGRGSFNLDAKYVYIKTDVKSGSTKVYELKINPLVIGAGFGYRF
ncbi:MAG: OmpW family protein [Gemmatimonadetes bacterium]|jgi:outer membrane protein|nr:OmpW family protein [Gemmatimonadota bacterium]MBK7352128.1 OmpW family protein [Gemmatimonadota bacterium]MBK7717288.1 OmpW family protein [Gemmatimonadota bacterium]MBK7784835.1 OmpW family protein [Gemmatimonadota bacterium]MBK7925790.1 OmpW family protein [Gemmatimonadota bacterium]